MSKSDAIAAVEAYFRAWNARDLEALAATLHPDVAWERSADFPEGRQLSGREPLLDFARSMFEVFVETPIELEEILEAAPGRVVVSGKSRFRGERSSAEISSRWVRTYVVEGSKIVAITAQPSLEVALDAARG